MAEEAPIVVSIAREDVVVQSVRVHRERGVTDRRGEMIGRPILWAEVTVSILDDGDEPDDPSGEEKEYYVYPSSEDAGILLRYNKRLEIEHDPDEAIVVIGAKNLIQWALGRPAGPGSAQVCSLDEWLDLFLARPEEDLAGYDSTEAEVEEVDEGEAADLLESSSWKRLSAELGFVPGVAYRNN